MNISYKYLEQYCLGRYMDQTGIGKLRIKDGMQQGPTGLYASSGIARIVK
jgi:hypothetical protein